MKLLHETISGHRVEFDEPEGELAEFFARARTAAADSAASENDLITLIYSADNPLLSPGVVPDRGVVTKDTLAHPVYRVLQDLLIRKRVAEQGLDVQAMADRHTVTIAEAAEQLGVHASAVQQAIKAQRLPSWVKGGRHYMAPSALDAFELSRRGPKPKGKPLRYCSGSEPGTSFRVKVPTSRVIEKKGKAQTAEVDTWARVAVLSGGEGRHRFFVLEPVASGSERLELGSFYVEGPFRVTKKVNNAREAREAYKAFEPA